MRIKRVTQQADFHWLGRPWHLFFELSDAKDNGLASAQRKPRAIMAFTMVWRPGIMVRAGSHYSRDNESTPSFRYRFRTVSYSDLLSSCGRRIRFANTAYSELEIRLQIVQFIDLFRSNNGKISMEAGKDQHADASELQLGAENVSGGWYGSSSENFGKTPARSCQV